MHAAVSTLPSDLAQIERDLWFELARAAREPGHEWRQMSLATTAADGWPDTRTVVLRECDPEERRLRFYTDARAGKAKQLLADPRGTLVAWSAQLSWQLRLRCQFDVITSGLSVASRWARIRLTPGAQDYLFPLAPGEELREDEAIYGPSALTSSVQEVGGWQPHPNTVAHHHFAVLCADVVSIDWLELAPRIHRRARFDSGGSARWLAP